MEEKALFEVVEEEIRTQEFENFLALRAKAVLNHLVETLDLKVVQFEQVDHIEVGIQVELAEASDQ
jgi:hypothetical protein